MMRHWAEIDGLTRDVSYEDPNLRELERPEGFVEPTETLNSLMVFDPSKFGLPPWSQSQ